MQDLNLISTSASPSEKALYLPLQFLPGMQRESILVGQEYNNGQRIIVPSSHTVPTSDASRELHRGRLTLVMGRKEPIPGS